VEVSGQLHAQAAFFSGKKLPVLFMIYWVKNIIERERERERL
jgi:hypothetical protein